MKTRTVLLVALCLLIHSFCATAQTKLSFNPVEGTKYLYQQTTQQTIKQTAMGQDIPMEMEMNFDYEMDVMETGASGTHVKFVYKDVEYYMTSAMMKMGYSSKNPIQEPSDMDKMMTKIFGCLIGKPFEMHIAPDGSVTSVTGMEAVINEMSEAVASDGQIAAQVGNSMKQQFSDQAVKSMFEQSFKIYPSKAVKPGESWNIAQTLTISGMAANTNAKYTLTEVKKNVASIAIESTIELKPGSGMSGNLSGTQAGTIQMETKTGMYTGSDMTQNLKGSLSANGVEVQMSIESKMKTTTTKIK